MTASLIIRKADSNDFAGIWPIFQEVAAGGDTYAYPEDISHDDARRIWIEQPRKAFNHPQQGYVDALVMYKLA